MSDEDTERRLIEFKVHTSKLEQLVVVCDDVACLRDLPRDRLPSHTEVRIAASILRRLLIDNGGELFKIWRSIDRDGVAPLTVEATDLGAFLKAWPSEWIWYAWAGGAQFPGAHHAGFVMYRVPKEVHEPYGSPEKFISERGMPGEPKRIRFSLSGLLESPGAAIQTDAGLHVIGRKRIIDYIANRKGGVHFDASRNLSVRGITNRRRNAEYHLLDHGLLRVGHLSGPEYEVVSIAQALVGEEWADELIRIGSENAPSEFRGDPAEMRVWTGMKEADGTPWATWTYGRRTGSAAVDTS